MESLRLRMGVRTVLVGAAFVAGGCLHSTAPTFDALDGRWTWIDATGGIAGTTITPATAGYTMTVEISGLSSTTPRMRVLRNGQFFAETVVERAQGSSTEVGTLVYRDPIMGFDQQEYTLTGTDRLVLQDGCCDGFTYRFERAVE